VGRRGTDESVPIGADLGHRVVRGRRSCADVAPINLRLLPFRFSKEKIDRNVGLTDELKAIGEGYNRAFLSRVTLPWIPSKPYLEKGTEEEEKEFERRRGCI